MRVLIKETNIYYGLDHIVGTVCKAERYSNRLFKVNVKYGNGDTDILCFPKVQLEVIQSNRKKHLKNFLRSKGILTRFKLNLQKHGFVKSIPECVEVGEYAVNNFWWHLSPEGGDFWNKLDIEYNKLYIRDFGES